MSSEQTAKKILKTATQMFAKNGFNGTVMDELAKKCKVNKASIYYHFKDKKTLYEASILGLLDEIAAAIHQAVEAEEPASKKLRAFIHAYALYAQKHHAFPSIIMREIASGGVTMPQTVKMKMIGLLSLLRSIVNEGAEAGEFNHVDPMMTHFMIIGSLNFYIASEPMRNAMETAEAGLDHIIKNKTIEEAADHVAQLVCNALKKGDSQ